MSNRIQLEALGLQLNPSIGAALHQQLYENIKRRITEGVIVSGFCFPPERIIVENLGIARPTLRQAFGRLEKEGYIVRRQGAGTFVQDASQWRPAKRALDLGIVVWTDGLRGHEKDLFAALGAEAVARGINVRTLTLETG